MTVSRRSFLTGAASTAAIAATGGIGAVAGGVAAPVVAPQEEMLDCLVEGWKSVRSQVWVSLPGQPMVYLGEAEGATLEVLTDEAKRQVTQAVMDSMGAPPGFSVAMPSRVGCTTLEEAKLKHALDHLGAVSVGKGHDHRLMIEESPIHWYHTDEFALIPQEGEVAEEDMLPVEIQGTIERTT